LKLLRIYLKQPSPSWLDYTLRNITLYMKRLDSKSQSFVPSLASIGVNTGSAAVAKESVSPFEQMKATLRNNLKGLKKEEEKDPSELGAQSTAA
jgi:hypothetical protein